MSWLESRTDYESLSGNRQPGGNLIERLLDAIEFSLGDVAPILEALRRLLKLVANPADEFAALFAHHDEGADAAEEDSESSKSIGQLLVLVHRPTWGPHFQPPMIGSSRSV